MPTSPTHLSGLRLHPAPAQGWTKARVLQLLADGTEAETRIREDRAVLVPFALLQGATPLEVARALGKWSGAELGAAINRWGSRLRRAGRIAPAQLDDLLSLTFDDIPEDW